jgi:hypothetical protein
MILNKNITKKRQNKENFTPSESSIGKHVKYGCIEATKLGEPAKT